MLAIVTRIDNPSIHFNKINNNRNNEEKKNYKKLINVIIYLPWKKWL